MSIPFDIIYISFDEPNAEENYRDLLTKFPAAKRVKNIKGLDNSHRKAASLAKKKNVLIVDGDNVITRDFFYQDFSRLENELPKDTVISWASKNIINGLIYGNGGLKLWPTHLLKNAVCHKEEKTDWTQKYSFLQMNDWFSYTVCNASPYQAFRTGFREGVKLCLDAQGKVISQLKNNPHLMPTGNRSRLLQWMSLGADVTNGYYAMFGARLGCLKVLCEESFDLKLLNDYDWLSRYWNEEFSYIENGYGKEHFDRMIHDLEIHANIYISNFSAEQSKAIKKMILAPKREGLLSPAPNDKNLYLNQVQVDKKL